MTDTDTSDARQYWEDHYGARDRVWSGRVNKQLAEIAATLPVGRALDVGCGEGGDVIWLAEQGWQVLGVDVSGTALQRAADDAAARGVSERVAFARHDLTETFPDGRFDLVSAQFLHSPVALDRVPLLRRAAEAVAPGGRLLIVDHGAAPSWAPTGVHEFEFPSAQEVVDSLNLDAAHWERTRVETVERAAMGPQGQPATLVDNVIQLRYVGAD